MLKKQKKNLVSLKLFDLLKTGKCSDDEIMSIFYLQFLNEEITMETFNELMKKLGCCLIDEFINLSVERHRETLSNIVKNNIKKNNLIIREQIIMNKRRC